MNASPIETKRLRLIPKSLAEVRAMIAAMAPADKVQLSADWLRQLEGAAPGVWTLGFSIVLQDGGTQVGQAGFKGPPSAAGVVELAYAIAPEFQGRGFATEAALALVDFASACDGVSLVRAHTWAKANASARVLTKCGFENVGEVVEPDDGLVWRWEFKLRRRRSSSPAD